jgi:hypothetical protein
MKMLAWLTLHTEAAALLATALFITAAGIVFGSW